MKRCTECHVPLPRDHKGPNLCAGCRLEAEDSGVTTPCGLPHGGPGGGKRTNDQDDPRLFSEKPERDRSIERQTALWAWREKIRARQKPTEDMLLFKKQYEMF